MLKDLLGCLSLVTRVSSENSEILEQYGLVFSTHDDPFLALQFISSLPPLPLLQILTAKTNISQQLLCTATETVLKIFCAAI